MAMRWRGRLRAAEQARFRSGLLGRLLTVLGISSLWFRRVSFTKRTLFLLAWAFVPRKMKLIVGGLAAAWLILAVAVTTAVVVVLAQLA